MVADAQNGLTVRGLEHVQASVRRMVAGLEAPKRIEIELPEFEQKKLQWLRAEHRNFFVVTADLRQQMVQAFARALLAATNRGRAGRTVLPPANRAAPWLAAAEVFWTRVCDRLSNGGGEIRGQMKKLKPDTIKRKGFDRIGFDTGELLRAALRVKQSKAFKVIF